MAASLATLSRRAVAPAALVVAVLSDACGGRTFEDDLGGTGGTAGHAGGGAGGSTNGAGGSAGSVGPNLPAPTRRLDSLGPAELTAVCLEDVRRTDLCMRGAMERRSPEECREELNRCSESPPVDEAIANCRDLRDIDDCPVTVSEYFACVDAWNLTQTCENAGHMIETPEPCERVVECQAFKTEFDQFGRPRACDPGSLVPKPPDTNDDIHGPDGCYPIPTRFIVLGHSNASAGGDHSAGAQLANYIQDTYSPRLEYQSHAQGAGLGGLEGIAKQMKQVEPGPGHVAVWIYTFPEDPHSLTHDLWQAQLGAVFDYFRDTKSFPDGASFLLTTQYSPSDQCESPLLGLFTSLTPEEEHMLQEINQKLFIDVALARADTVTVDLYPDWLGHAGNANVFGCPHCSTDNTLWQADHVHPNELGRQQIANKWKVAVDRMYGGGCR
jgi:hypothetical protein